MKISIELTDEVGDTIKTSRTVLELEDLDRFNDITQEAVIREIIRNLKRQITQSNKNESTPRVGICRNCFKPYTVPSGLYYGDPTICPECTGSGSQWYSSKFEKNYDKCEPEHDPCEYCQNNPKNGGSGICHCTLGIKTKVTC